jgi:hypothetical protein
MLGKIVRYLSSIIFAAVITAIIAANIQKYLATKHWDEFLLKGWPSMPDLTWLTTSNWTWGMLGLSGGLALALWIVRLWPEEGKEPIFDIVKAEYWTKKTRKDVTGILTNMVIDLISKNKIEFIVLNEALGGDPDIGTRKTLTIEYKFNRHKLTKECREAEIMVIP